MPLVQVVIDDSTLKTITGTYVFDRDGGGTLQIPEGSSFPGSPIAKEFFFKTDENVLYRRNDANTSWVGITAASEPYNRQVVLDYTDTGSNNIGDVIPAGSIIVVVAVQVITAFDGTSPTVTIGDAGDTDRLLEAGDSDLAAINKYMDYSSYPYASETQLTATLSIGGTPTTGQCVVMVLIEV